MAIIKGQLEQAQVENVTADPSNLPLARVWFNKTTDRLKAKFASAIKTLVTEDDTQVISNKELASIKLSSADQATTADITALSATKPIIRFTGATNTNVHGILSTSATQAVTLFNASSANITLKHQSVTATAIDRIITPSGSDLLIQPNSSAEFFYDTTLTRWVIKSGSGSGNSVRKTTVSNLTNGATLTITDSDFYQEFLLSSTTDRILMSLTPFGVATTPIDGTEITLIGASDDNYPEFDRSDSAKSFLINGNMELTRGRILKVKYLSTLDRYVEISRG